LPLVSPGAQGLGFADERDEIEALLGQTTCEIGAGTFQRRHIR
jgi:hypothetical protein